MEHSEDRRPEDRRQVEQALRKHLGRTSAPVDLWAGIQQGRARSQAPATVGFSLRWAAAVAGLCVTMGAGFMAWRLYEPAVSVEAMAVASLNQGPEHLALQSSSAAEIRSWVKANSNLDIPLPALKSRDIEIIGANILPAKRFLDKQPAVEVSYRVGKYQAALLISKDSTGARTYPNHLSQTVTPESGARVSSWKMRGQNYTLAWGSPGEFKTACLLCHTGSDRAMN